MDAALPRDAAFPPHPESSAEARAGAADAVACSSLTEAATRATSDRAANDGEASRQATPLTRSLRKAAGRFMAGVGKHFATLAIALVAILISVATWQHYVTAPWTRNGRVRVQVANVAPQIAGKIVELRVADNQFVHKGDVLYVIDRKSVV